LPSPITIGNYVLVVNMKGILTCYDAKSGKELWVERLAGNYSAAPIAYDGLAFFITEAGETVVVKAGPKADVVGRYGVGGSDTEIFRSSHTPSDGQVFIRSDRVLYCVGKRNAAE
jgi:outer membrane protein assembly factor BamB